MPTPHAHRLPFACFPRFQSKSPTSLSTTPHCTNTCLRNSAELALRQRLRLPQAHPQTTCSTRKLIVHNKKTAQNVLLQLVSELSLHTCIKLHEFHRLRAASETNKQEAQQEGRCATTHGSKINDEAKPAKVPFFFCFSHAGYQ